MMISRRSGAEMDRAISTHAPRSQHTPGPFQVLIPRTARALSLQMDGCTQAPPMADSCAVSRVSAKPQTCVRCLPLTPTYLNHLPARRGGVGRQLHTPSCKVCAYPRADLAGTRPKRR